MLNKTVFATLVAASAVLCSAPMFGQARVDQQLVALREKYVPIFEKVVSPKKTALVVDASK